DGLVFQGFAHADHLEVIHQGPGVGQHRGHSFPGINGAAAADGQNHVATPGLCQRYSLFDRGNFRFMEDGKSYHRDVIVLQAGYEGIGAGCITAGDDQGAAAKFAGKWSGLTQSSRAKNDACRSGKFEVHRLLTSSPTSPTTSHRREKYS